MDPTSTAAILPAPTASTEDKVDATVAVAGAVAAGLIPSAKVGAVIAEGVQLEPEIYHLISALIHMFRKQKPAAV